MYSFLISFNVGLSALKWCTYLSMYPKCFDNMNLHTYYDILEISVNSSREEIQKAFKKKLLSTHPDKFQTKKLHSLCHIQAAWDVLKDNDRRRAYDYSLLSGRGYSEKAVVYEEIHLVDMRCHQINGCNYTYIYKCRCSGEFILSKSDADLLLSRQIRHLVLSCSYCSQCIEVN